MSSGVAEYRADRKRLEQSLLISILIWLVILGLFALIPVRPAKVPESSMNPVYIDLAPPVEEPLMRAQETNPTTADSAGTSGAATAAAAAAAASPATATANPTLASGGAAVAAAKPAPAQAAPQRASPQEAAQAAPQRASQSTAAPQGQGTSRQPSASQGQASPMAAPTARNPYQGRGGEDPFAPLSESDLAAENPEAPAAPAGPVQQPQASSAQQAQRTNTSGAAGSRNAPAEADALAQRVKNTTEGLSERGGSASATGSSGTSTGTSSAAAPASGRTTGSSTAQGGTGAGALQGALDFGDGPGRRLLSAPPVAIPAKLLEGQPALLETTVRFRIDKGGTVIALSIQFDPPLPLDIAEYLKTYVFSRWVFSASNSDGQVRFKYSIKVQ